MVSLLRFIKKLIITVSKAMVGFRTMLVSLWVLDIIAVAASLAFVFCSKKVIDIATGNSEGSFFSYSVILVSILLFQVLCQNFTRWYSVRISSVLVNKLRSRYFDHILRSKWNEAEKFRTGDLQTRVMSDISDFVSLIVYIIPGIIKNAFELIAAFIFLYFLNPVLAVTICVITPCFLVFSKAYFRRMREITHNIKEYEGKISTMLNESFLNRNVLKAFDFQQKQSDNYNSLQRRKLGFIFRKNNFSSFSNLLVSICFGTGYLLAFLWGSWQISLGVITFGTMTAFLQLANRIQSPALDLLSTIPAIINTKTSIERLDDINGFALEMIEKPLKLGSSLSVEVENVCFGYEEGETVLDNISMKFNPGSVSLITGRSGAGKTTLIRLLLGLIKPKSGKVSIHTKSGKSVTASESTRNNFVYVPQGNTLFGTTIRENILLGNPQATEKEIERAIYMSASEFIYSLPNGLDTLLSENGSGVSQGQSQRIAIARALLRPGSVLLLDEATSALDETTEDLILSRLKEKNDDKTIIMISHNNKIRDISDNIYRI